MFERASKHISLCVDQNGGTWSHTEGLSCAEAQGQWGNVVSANMYDGCYGWKTERARENGRDEGRRSLEAEDVGLLLGRGIQDANTFRLVWVF